MRCGKGFLKQIKRNENKKNAFSKIVTAVRKHGRDNFTKRILYAFDNEDDMNTKERELVDIIIVNDPMYYNAVIGGQGGNIVLKPDHPLYEVVCRKISNAQSNRRDAMSKITKRNHELKRVGMYGKKQSEKQKTKVSEMWKGIPKTDQAKRKQKVSLLATLRDPNYIHPNKGRKKTSEQIDRMRSISANRPKKT